MLSVSCSDHACVAEHLPLRNPFCAFESGRTFGMYAPQPGADHRFEQLAGATAEADAAVVAGIIRPVRVGVDVFLVEDLDYCGEPLVRDTASVQAPIEHTA